MRRDMTKYIFKRTMHVIRFGALLMLTASMALSMALIGCIASDTAAYDLSSMRARTPKARKPHGSAEVRRLKTKDSDGIAFRLKVDGTRIDYPVMIQRPSDPDGFYLTHTPSRKKSILGSLYLDRESSPDGKHLLIYGHRLGSSNLMFSPLSGCWHQDHFDRLSSLEIIDAQGTRSFSALCSMQVDMSFGDIRRFDFTDDRGLQAWLGALCDESSARARDWRGLIREADGVCSTVTCSGKEGGRMRTIVIWTESESP